MTSAQKNQAYPLHWPKGWKRTPRPSNSRFKTSLAGAIRNVQSSLTLFAADSGEKINDLVVSTNVTIMDNKPSDPGVAVYFSWHGSPVCIAVDRYKTVQENLQAIHHVIEAERTKLRHGGLHLVQASFRGYAALPPPGNEEVKRFRSDWWVTLGCQPSATLNTAKSAWRTLSKKHHPDHGGDPAKFEEVQYAWKRAQEQFAN